MPDPEDEIAEIEAGRRGVSGETKQLQQAKIVIEKAKELASWVGHIPKCRRGTDSVYCICGARLSITCNCNAGSEQVEALAAFNSALTEFEKGPGL